MNMKLLATTVISLTLLATASVKAQDIEITPNGSRAPLSVSAQNFTGGVKVDPLFGVHDRTNLTVGNVTFAPGARTAWHSHPAGQILIVTSGAGWIQEWGGEKRDIKPGDVVWIPPGVKHWHGATETSEMSHIAIQEMIDGKNAEWMEEVTDAQYDR